jgi:hypothetical protein
MSEERKTPPEEPTEQGGLPEEEFSSLMDSISTAAPLLRGLGGALTGQRSEACAVREKFLLSLKPYLSPERSAAVDYLVRVARLGDILHTLK